MTLNALFHFVLFTGITLISSDPLSAAEEAPSAFAAEKVTVYEVKGVLKEVREGGNKALIDHEEIPGYMEAMTMELPVGNPKEMSSLRAGDKITFRLSVTETDGWIDRVRKIGEAPLAPVPAPSASAAAVVPVLKQGDVLPEFSLLNQNGEIVQLSKFKGRALAISFIFTRCPFPTFCPLMNNNFREVQNELLKTNPEKKWHLLSVSIDPEYDTPERLAKYAESYRPDYSVWSFLTGDNSEVRRFAASFGLVTSGSGTALNHNLRTVVVNASGRVQNVIVGNEWEPQELVEELKRAARKL